MSRAMNRPDSGTIVLSRSPMITSVGAWMIGRVADSSMAIIPNIPRASTSGRALSIRRERKST
jgi:hypothetical protein